MSDDATDEIGGPDSGRTIEERPARGLRWRLGWLAPQGWTAFVGEIVVVIAGVLIALGAGELVTAWNWQRKVVEGEQQLAAELRRGYVSAMEQVVVSPCVQAQLDALSAGVMASGDTLTPFPVLDTPVSRTVVSIPVRSYLDGTWRALLDDGTLPHLASERRQLYDLAYERFERIEARNADAVTSRGRLLVLSQPIPLDPSVRLALLRELGEQSVRSRFQRLSAVQGMRAVDALGHTPDRASIDAYLDASVTVTYCRAAGLPLTDVDVAMQDDGTRAPAP
jgi:hypothetical protein